ncbi:hypothetical protein H311_01153, partial [Anncaliia algerae PRA109]
EAMLNYECKSHRGRSSKDKTDFFSIVDCTNGILELWQK